MSSAVEKLERDFATWLGVPGAVAAGYGRGGLLLALQSAGVEGSNVAVPDFVCAQVPGAVTRAGGRPAFYRVQRDLTLDLEKFRAVVEPGCGAAIVVHYLGQAHPQIATIAAICRERSVLLIEDCALALGATSASARAGRFGDFAVFSFTKADWCYGGGLVAARSAELLIRLRQASEQISSAAPGLALRYGALRRLDCAANRPCWSRASAAAGRLLQSLVGPAGVNFYDAGRFDTRMPELAARRTGRLLEQLEARSAQQRRIVTELASLLSGVEHILLRPSLDPGDTGAFVLFQSPAGRASLWVEEAGRESVQSSSSGFAALSVFSLLDSSFDLREASGETQCLSCCSSFSLCS